MIGPSSEHFLGSSGQQVLCLIATGSAEDEPDRGGRRKCASWRALKPAFLAMPRQQRQRLRRCRTSSWPGLEYRPILREVGEARRPVR